MRLGSLIFILTFFISCGSKKTVAPAKPKVFKEKKIAKSTQKEYKKISVKIQKNKKPEKQKVQPKKKANKQSEKTLAYIKRFSPIAVREMHRYQIPASIKLAQGILESGSGYGPLALRSNNHFGIKCHTWSGRRVSYDDDKKGECFRKYTNPEDSYKDHSKFLTSRKRYAGLFKLKLNDYKAWAYGLKYAGYATDYRYPTKLISIIERFELHKYDKILPGQKIVEYEYKQPNNISATVHIVKKGDTLYSLAKRYRTTVNRIKQLNNLNNNIININQELIIRHN